MKRRQVLILLGCLVLGMGILLSLYAFSPLSKEIHRASFRRNFLDGQPLREKAVMNIEFNSFYIAGTTANNIYLGNSTAPAHLLIANRTLTDSQHVMLKIKLDSIRNPRKFKLAIDSPNFYLAHGVMPELLQGKIDSWEATRCLDSLEYFVEAVPISSSSFAFRSYSASAKGYELAKISKHTPFKFNHDLLQKQIDGIFCSDGQLHYNKELGRMVYLHYYRNEFIVADSNLDLQYRGHTIDTFSRAQVKVSTIGSKNTSMLGAPPMQINGTSCVSGKYLFVRSNLLAKNEQIETFIEDVVIDMYDLNNGEYVHSFYIKNYKNRKPTDFKISGNNLVAIYDRYLVLYELDSMVFISDRHSK